MKTSPKDKESMTKIGTIYGKDIYVDTTDPSLIDLINKYFDSMELKVKKLARFEIKEEIKKFTQGFAYKKTK